MEEEEGSVEEEVEEELVEDGRTRARVASAVSISGKALWR